MNPRNLVVGAGLLGVGVLVAVLVCRPEPPTSTPSSDAVSSEVATPSAPTFDAVFERPRLEWREGERLRYALDYRTHTRTDVGAAFGGAPGQLIEGHVALEAVVALDVVETYADGAMRGRLAVESVSAGSLAIGSLAAMDRSALADALGATELWIALGPCGDVREVGVAGANGGGVGTETLRTIVQDARFAVCAPDGAADWTAYEATPHGIARQAYTTVDAHRVDRVADGYASLRVAGMSRADAESTGSGSATVVDGTLRSVAADETLRWESGGALRVEARTSVTMAWLDTAPVAAEYAEAIAWSAPDARPLSRDVERRLLERRAEGVSARDVAERVAAHVPGDGPGYREFMWRAPARIALEGETLVPAMVAQARNAAASPAPAAVALDLLAQTGTERASLGLLEALQAPELRSHPYYPVYVQRVSLVQDPPAALVDWTAATAVGADDPEVRWAANYALGSLVAALDAAERGDEADPHHRVLADALAAEGDAQARAHRVRALSNAERASDAPALLALVDDPEVTVRAAVATGLEMLPGRASLDGLMTLAGDADAMVQRTALLGLRVQPLVAGDLEPIRDYVRTGRLSPRNERVLVETLANAAAVDPVAALELADMLSVTSEDAQVVAAAETLRNWVGAR